MAWMIPGHLYRTLDKIGVPTPLLTITGDTFAVTDDQITSVSIGHGGTDPSPGVQPSTCEAVLQRPSWTKTGENFAVALTAAATSALSTHTGQSINSIRNRFTGRVGRQTNTDNAGRLVANMTAASWSAQLPRIRTSYFLPDGTGVHDALRFLCSPDALPAISWMAYGDDDILAEPIADATYKDTAGKLTADIGTLVRDTRDGTLEAWSLPYRETWAAQRLADRYPLTRSQAISPATWDQPNEDIPVKVRADWIDAAGNPYARSSGGTPETIVERHDWTHIQAQTGALDMHFEALVNQGWNRLFRLPTVTVDLLYLLSSPREYHRGQAGMLLALNAGDPIGLSGDWPEYLRGLHFVTGLTETITKDEWMLDLSLVPYSLVLGENSPTVPAMVWDSATYPWNTETRSWDF